MKKKYYFQSSRLVDSSASKRIEPLLYPANPLIGEKVPVNVRFAF